MRIWHLLSWMPGAPLSRPRRLWSSGQRDSIPHPSAPESLWSDQDDVAGSRLSRKAGLLSVLVVPQRRGEPQSAMRKPGVCSVKLIVCWSKGKKK
jgi:hypothetical protein